MLFQIYRKISMIISSFYIASKTGERTIKKAIVNCEICKLDREIEYSKASKKQEHNCRQCAPKTHEDYKGWRYTTGYKQIYVEGYHPRKKIKTKTQKVMNYVFEHIIVMEKHIGRFLEEDEVVHHIDENRLNNDISNLYLCTKSNHGKLHQKIENLAILLYKHKLINFEDGKYVESNKLATISSKLL